METSVRIKSRRLVDSSLQRLLFLKSDNWSWSTAALDKIKGWETKVMRRLFRFKRKEEETWRGYCMRTARAARTVWKKIRSHFGSSFSRSA